MARSLLFEHFTAKLGARARDALATARPSADADAELEARLEALWAQAGAPWPGVTLAPADFAAVLAAKVGDDDPLLRLDDLHVADLFLATACAGGDTPAIAHFEATLRPTISAALRRLRIGADAVEELEQALREQLFVSAPPRGEPLIASYSGRGQLRNWLRIIAVRTAGKFLDKGRREVQMTESMLGELGPASADPELEHLKQTYRGEFRRAFEQALASLSSRDRVLLGHTYVDRLTIDEIGTIYSVHRATAARRVARAREALLTRTRQTLMQQVKIDRSEYDSIMRLIESQLPVSFSQLAGAPSTSSEGASEPDGSSALDGSSTSDNEAPR